MEEQLSKIVEQLEKLGQPGILSWIAALGPVLTLVIIGFYIFQFSKNYGKQRCEKAIEYAKEYSEKILNNILYLDTVYKLAGIDIDEKLDLNDMKCFTKEEFSKLCESKQEFNEISNIDYEDIISRIAERNRLSILFSERRLMMVHGGLKITQFIDGSSSSQYSADYIKNLFIKELKVIRTSTLNTLEYMAMYFTTQVASKKAVYDSLHITYLLGFRYFYCYLAKSERFREQSPYPHAIKLYNRWNRKYYAKEQARKKKQSNPTKK